MKKGRFTVLGALCLSSLCFGACETHRWAFVRISAAPHGATVRSKGLGGEHRLARTKAPAEHLIPCNMDVSKPAVQVKATHWSYIVQKADFNDEELFVERSAIRAHCSNTKDDARARPLRLHAKLVPITTEKGLKNTIKLTSAPPGVTVYDAGTRELIGKTPLKSTFTFFAPYKVGRVLLFRMEGYQLARRSVYARTINLHVKMLRPGETARPAPPKEPARKRRAPPPRR